jgi:hypothetical protein
LLGNSGTYGGGIFNYFATITVTGDLLSGNSATIGGGIENDSGTLYIGTSAFIGNSPDDIAGGYIDLGRNSKIKV